MYREKLNLSMTEKGVDLTELIRKVKEGGRGIPLKYNEVVPQRAVERASI